ncbi:MAG: transposase, partial [Oceanicaulis sp.]
MSADYRFGHLTVNHSQGEHVCGGAHTYTVESYFALLKGGVYGTFQSISKKHVWRFSGMFSFRWNLRLLNGGDAMVEAVKSMVGKPLPYSV